MSGAVDCLEFLPDELVVEVSRGLAACADDLHQCKRLLYEVLAKHYGHAQRPPLFSNHVFDIHSGISELLGELGVAGVSWRDLEPLVLAEKKNECKRFLHT